jgi:para-aminobenzoate synthetase/4-amino-4-deoxychorismate lyase
MSESLRGPRGAIPAGFDPALPFALLESSRAPAGEAASMLFWAPERAIVAARGDAVEAAFDALDEARREGLFPCGYIAYEAGYVVAGGPRFTARDAGRGALPLVSMQAFARRAHLDRAAVDALLEALSEGAPCAVHDVRLSHDRAAYGADIARILAYIRAGDTYQVNYTLKARFAFAGPPAALYRELRRHQAVEFGALLAFPEARVLSLSPELFLRKEGTTLVSKPMKGTARRGATPAEDDAIRAALRADPKTLSENLMIVDLIRNDLGRLAESGTVTTRDLFEIQTFETVHQMVSTIEARVDRELPVGTALRHLLPCGSITGAPKIRTMEIIEELEAEPRGVYCGAIGHVAPDGDFAFNVPIRTVVSTTDGRGELGIGSGIVAEADAGAEYDECLLKARFLGAVNSAFQIIETMRLEPGAVLPERFDRHLARMAASASAFGFAFDAERVAAAVRAVSGQPGRVRALLFHDGRVEVTSAPIASRDAASSRRVAWSPQRIESASIFQRHKTTVRVVYNRAFDEASAAGAYDVLFLNERGEVAEASRHNVFIERGGVLLTPPLASGALPGLARAAILETPSPAAREAVLRVEDVMGAERVLLCNAVRGLVQVTPAPPPDDTRAPRPARG